MRKDMVPPATELAVAGALVRFYHRRVRLRLEWSPIRVEIEFYEKLW
jgi:hypothetical protein